MVLILQYAKNINYDLGASNMVQWVKMLDMQPEDLSWVCSNQFYDQNS